MFSVLYQGNDFSGEVIKKINSYAKSGIDVVISTWIGNEFDDDFHKSVKIVKIHDPGADIINSISNNYTRQINGVLAGLDACSGKYVLKLRSDLTINLNKMLKLINKNKLNVVDVTTKIYGSFHFCDWVYYSRKEDLIGMYENVKSELLQWASIEELLYISFSYNRKYSDINPQIIRHKDIDLVCTKSNYRFILFGKNIALTPTAQRVKAWNEANYSKYFKGFNDLFLYRYLILKPLWRVKYSIFYLFNKIKKCF